MQDGMVVEVDGLRGEVWFVRCPYCGNIVVSRGKSRTTCGRCLQTFKTQGRVVLRVTPRG